MIRANFWVKPGAIWCNVSSLKVFMKKWISPIIRPCVIRIKMKAVRPICCERYVDWFNSEFDSLKSSIDLLPFVRLILVAAIYAFVQFVKMDGQHAVVDIHSNVYRSRTWNWLRLWFRIVGRYSMQFRRRSRGTDTKSIINYNTHETVFVRPSDKTVFIVVINQK